MAWPDLPFAAWKDTGETLHLWLQIVGKIALAQSAWVNHQWHVTLRVTPRGLATQSLPHGTRTFQLELDFVDHRLTIAASDGRRASLPLEAQPTASFYTQLMRQLEALALPVRVSRRPNELAHAIPFDQDETHASYDPAAAQRFWRALVQADRVFRVFRARFRGKSSPVHFFWGAADLALTRFSARPAPPHPGGVPNLPDWVVREAYSHEVSSCGFWPGSESYPQPAFYAYAYPEPPGYSEAAVQPEEARYDSALHEFVLPYDEVRQAPSPDAALLAFLQSTYEAAADLGKWDRVALDMPPVAGRAD